MLELVNSTSGLVDISVAFLGPGAGGSAFDCASVQVFNKLAEIAAAINNTASASKYQTAAETMSDIVNNTLFNPTLGVHGLSPASLDNYGVSSINFCITSRVPNTTQAAQFLSTLPTLLLRPGYKDSTQFSSNDSTVNISPNTNCFLVESLLSQRTSTSSTTALNLIKSLWTIMLANNETSPGASWEHVDLEGNPGLALHRSLSPP